MKGHSFPKRFVVIFVSVLVILSCSISGEASPDPAATQAALDMEQTRIALNVQSTSLAAQQTQVAEITEQARNAPQPTYTPLPTYTAVVPPTVAPLPTMAPAAAEPTAEPTTEPTVDIQDKIRKANILVFEDIRGYPALDTRVSRAIEGMDFSGGRIIQVGDAVGNFMTELNSPVKWDLIIVAAEARSAVRGEFWDVILDQVNRNVALIVEIWYLDDIANGRISSLMGKCGIAFQKDWYRDPGSNPLDYSMYWLQPDSEVFTIYNTVGPLYTSTIYWDFDAGDMIRLGSGGDATLLAGLFPKERSSYGTLATCLEGRMIMQTFCSHDYKYNQVVPLWQNYIMYTLTNHFKKVQ